MPATSDRAQYVKQGFRLTEVGPLEDVREKYGDSARKSIEPISTFFESEADAEAIRDERIFLLSRDARLFNHVIAGEDIGLSLGYNVNAPQCTVIDDRRTANYPAIVAEIKVNFGSQTTDLLTWGGEDPNMYRITTVGEIRMTSTGDLRIYRSGSFVRNTRVPAGDMQSGSDRRIPAGDMNDGGDVRIT